MSSQLKEKQQQKDNKRELDADNLFNQHLFRTLAYAGAGFGAGLVASVFLKNRKALTLLGAGSGAAYGATNFMSELNQFGRFKDYANQSQQSHTLKREDQTSTKNWEDFMPKQESLSQQKRFGGSGDDDEKGKSSKNESKTKPQTQSIRPSESLHSSPTGSKESPSLNTRSSHDKTLDKTSQEFGHNKSEISKKASLNKDDDKSSQHSGSQKFSSSKSSSSSHKESDKSSQDQQKSESSKNLSQGKEQQKSSSSNFESKSDSKGQGQHLQDFKTNKGPGKPAPGESEIYRGAERNVHADKKVEHLRNQQNRNEQDRWGHTRHTGNRQKEAFPPENIAGGQFSGANLTAGSQTNAVIE